MPEPVGRTGQRYMPGLDGLRAVAVLAVIAYHLDLGWAQGGLLGVGVFFTLSGYLITDILMEAWSAERLKLGQFWLARARRLLPALFVMLVVVMAWVTIGDPAQLEELRGVAISSALFTSNWWVIFQDVSYFDRFGPVSPLGHLWSLAIEEQFYIVWPWLLLLGLKFIPGRKGADPVNARRRVRPRLAAVTLVLAAASAVLMAVLFEPGFDTTRVYEGTDTRAFGLLLGAALAMVWPSRRLRANIPDRARRQLDVAGVLALAVIVLLIWRTDQYSAFIYQGGLVLLSVATVVVVAVLAHPASRLGPALGWTPLRWIGVRSYGIYLWQLPIIALTTPAGAGFDLVRSGLQVLAIMVVSALSWRFIEDPVRKGAIGRIWRRMRAGEGRPRLGARSGIVTGLVAACSVIAIIGLFGLGPSERVAPLAVTSASESQDELAGELAAPPVVTETVVKKRKGSHASTRCEAVAYIGDSTSVGLTSKAYLPRRKYRLGPQFARQGALRQRFDIAGARSIIETVGNVPNAYDAAKAIRKSGFEGCWVLGLGTNDTANQAVGSPFDSKNRIERMMSVIGDDPVMWVNVKTLLKSGPYANANMKRWNEAVEQACLRHPGLMIFDWPSKVRDSWYIEDGIHFTSRGYAARSHAIANALSEAFPPWILRRYRPPCVVS
ncbi:MAG TPA: acyltransferase family protein [Solirubrobacterales bacterium]|nr:acyltransferase family protein [Solirubrobacterales bacterium]